MWEQFESTKLPTSSDASFSHCYKGTGMSQNFLFLYFLLSLRVFNSILFFLIKGLYKSHHNLEHTDKQFPKDYPYTYTSCKKYHANWRTWFLYCNKNPSNKLTFYPAYQNTLSFDHFSKELNYIYSQYKNQSDWKISGITHDIIEFPKNSWWDIMNNVSKQ